MNPFDIDGRARSAYLRRMAIIRTLILLLICTVPRAALPDEKEPQRPVSVEIEAGTLASSYVWRGIRLSEGAVVQSSATVSFRGLCANLWGNFDLETRAYNEMDLTLSYSREVNNLTFETGFIHTGLVDLHDSDEIYVSVGADYPAQMSLAAYFDVNAGTGAFLRPSVGRTFRLSGRTALDLTAAAGVVFHNGFMGVPDSGDEFAGFYNAEAAAAVPVKLGKGWEMRFYAAASTPLSRKARQAIVNSSVCRREQRFCNGTIVHGGATLLYAF